MTAHRGFLSKSALENHLSSNGFSNTEMSKALDASNVFGEHPKTAPVKLA
jgi:hypothetical protein